MHIDIPFFVFLFQGCPDLNSDLIIRENTDGSVSLESVISPGSYIACYSGGSASDPHAATKARNFALSYVQVCSCDL